MESQPKVLFYGNSLVLAGVQATFKAYAGFEVIALDRPASVGELLAYEPGVLDFELLVAPMQQLPDVLLIGVDAESHEVLLSGQAVCSISLEQITQIVRELVGSRSVQPASPPQIQSSVPSTG